MKRHPNRDKAWKYYLKHKGSVTLKDIAKRFGVGESTIRRWKKEDGWDENVPQKRRRSKPKPFKSASTVKYELIPSSGLNDKQLLFCMYYMQTWNATKAYQRAYRCDYRTAHANAYRLMANDGVKTEIERLKREVIDSVMIDARQVLQMYIDIARADMKDFIDFGTAIVERQVVNQEGIPLVDDDGKPIVKTKEVDYMRLKNAEDVDGTLIASLKKTKDGFAISLFDKHKAIDVLARYYDLFSDDELKRLRADKLRADIKAIEEGGW